MIGDARVGYGRIGMPVARTRMDGALRGFYSGPPVDPVVRAAIIVAGLRQRGARSCP